MSNFHTVCKTHHLAGRREQNGRDRQKADGPVYVDGNYFAIDDVCPHMGASLSGGQVEDGIVTCPWHAWRFRLTDGAWADNPRIKIGCYPVRIEGEQIQIQVDQPPTCPQPRENVP